MSILKINDQVIWRGGWGEDAPKIAKVTAIEINCNGSKEGDEVAETSWDNIKDRDAIISLDNDHWCWGFQISPITSTEEPSSIVPDDKVQMLWECPECKQQESYGPEWYQDNGTPMCECDEDMVYIHTKILK